MSQAMASDRSEQQGEEGEKTFSYEDNLLTKPFLVAECKAAGLTLEVVQNLN